MKKLVVIALTLILSACATSNFTSTDTLDPSEGLATFTFNCTGVQTLDLYPSGTTFEGDVFNPSTFKSSARIPCSSDKGAVIVKLPQGEYFVGSVMAYTFVGTQIKGKRDYIAENNAFKFSIEPSIINYIGDVKTTTKSRGSSHYKTIMYKLDVENNFKELKKKLSEENTELANRYKLKSNVAKK